MAARKGMITDGLRATARVLATSGLLIASGAQAQ